MIFDTSKLKGLTYKHFYTDADKSTGKICLYVNSDLVGYVTYEKEEIENLFSKDEYIKISEVNDIEQVFPTKYCYYIGFLEVVKNQENKGYGNILMTEILNFLDDDNFSNLFIIHACPYLREKEGETWQNTKTIPIDILVQFYKRFGFRTLLDQGNTQLMYRLTK